LGFASSAPTYQSSNLLSNQTTDLTHYHILYSFLIFKQELGNEK